MARAKIEFIKPTETTYQDCSICLKPMKKLIKRTACNHCFHPQCLNKWLQEHANCPLCRAEVYTRKQRPVRRNLEEEFQNVIDRLRTHLNEPTRAFISITNDTLYVEDDETIIFTSIRN